MKGAFLTSGLLACLLEVKQSVSGHFLPEDNARIVPDLIIKVLEEWELAWARCCSALGLGFSLKKSRMSYASPCSPVKIFSL